MPPIRNARELKQQARSRNFLNSSSPQYQTVNRFTQKLMDLQDKLKSDSEKALKAQVAKYSRDLMNLQMHDTPAVSPNTLNTSIIDVTVDLPYYLKTPGKGKDTRTGYQQLVEAGEKYGAFTKAELDEAMTLVGQGMGVEMGVDDPEKEKQKEAQLAEEEAQRVQLEAEQQAIIDAQANIALLEGEAEQKKEEKAEMPGQKKSYPQLRQMLNEIKEIQARPAPDMNDVNLDDKAAYDYFVPQLRADYKDDKIARSLIKALKELPEEKKKEFIAKAKGPNAEKDCTEKEWLTKLNRGRTYKLLDNRHWGRTDGNQIVDALEAVLPPEKLQELNTLSANLKAPDEPGYTGPLEEEPYKEQIQALKKKAALENPFTAESTAKYLDQVNGYLSRVSNEFRDYLRNYDAARNNETNSLNKMSDWTITPMVLRGQQTLAGGRFKGTFKSRQTKYEVSQNNGKSFMASDTDNHAKPLTDADVADLSGTPSPISQTAVEAAEKIFGTMDTLEFTNAGAVMPAGDRQTFEGQKPNDIMYQPEQGTKYYAFWPLIDKKDALGEAVKEGDLDKIRTAAEEYKKTEDKYTFMMDTLKDPKLGGNKLYDGNVNSTRESTPDMPMKFVRDNITHNQLNSMYCMHATAKNFGVDVMDMVKDPVNTTLKACRNYKKSRGIDSKSTIGGKLCWGLQKGSGSATHFNSFDGDWITFFESPRSRGLSGVVNLEPDPKKRAEYVALSGLGAYAADTEIKKEKARFVTMNEIAVDKAPNAGEKRAALYRNAALLPPDRFSMEKMADVFGDKKDPERWRRELDVSALTTGSKLYELDYADLATRTETVLRQHDAEKVESGAYMSAFDKDEYVLNAFSVYSQILANAKNQADLQADENFMAFKHSVRNMPNLVKNPDIKAMMAASLKVAEEPNYFMTLTTDKNDRVFGKKDSKEYTDMKKSLTAVGRYVDVLKNGPRNNKEALATGKGGRFAAVLQEAADDCFKYARLKTDNGAKTSFSAASGATRVEESLEALRNVQRLQDEQGLRSPAQKMYDDARLELLTKRHDKAWMQAHGLETVAKVIHAKRAMDAQIPAEYQAAAFAPEKWQKEFAKLKTRKEFRDFVAGAGPDVDSLAENALSGGKRFTKCVDDMAKTVAAAYKKQVTEPKEAQKLADAKEGFIQGWAMEVAAKQLGLTQRRRFDENPALQAKAREVRNDPEFKEVIGEMMKGKTNQELLKSKTAHISPLSDVDSYEVSKRRIQYEKQCAELVVMNTMSERLAKLSPEEQRKEMDTQIARCREMPAFQNVMNQRFEGVDKDYIADRLLKEIKKPEEQEKLWDDVVAEQHKVLQAEAAKPVQPVQPRQPQAAQGGPEVGQPGEPEQEQAPVV